MELSKYPVIYNENEYRVDISKDYLSLGEHQWKVQVYKFLLKTLPFGRTKCKWEKVYTYNSGWHDYKKWLDNFIELAKLVVIRYEESIKAQEESKNKEKQGIKQWNEWDGVIE